MKKRLRKKKHLGEFQELGFRVRFRFPADLPTAECNRLLEEWVTQAVEGNGLLLGGGGGADVWEGFVTKEGRGSATEEHRLLVTSWLGAHPLVLEYTVSPLVDAWHLGSGE